MRENTAAALPPTERETGDAERRSEVLRVSMEGKRWNKRDERGGSEKDSFATLSTSDQEREPQTSHLWRVYVCECVVLVFLGNAPARKAHSDAETLCLGSDEACNHIWKRYSWKTGHYVS